MTRQLLDAPTRVVLRAAHNGSEQRMKAAAEACIAEATKRGHRPTAEIWTTIEMYKVTHRFFVAAGEPADHS